MNMFAIINGLPYLIDKGKAFKVRWDDKGFTVGGEAKVKIPEDVYLLSELSITAICPKLDSIGAAKKKGDKVD